MLSCRNNGAPIKYFEKLTALAKDPFFMGWETQIEKNTLQHKIYTNEIFFALFMH